MRSIIAKWSIKPGCEQQAVTAFGELAESVRREEPFALMYLIHTPNADGSRPTYQFGKWVTMLGGEYFFLPSLSLLTGITT
jgi:hypothetical protein